MDSFLLNINDYSDKELEDILSLSYPYQQEDIVLKKNETHFIINIILYLEDVLKFCSSTEMFNV